MADIVDKFILTKVSRDTAKMTTSGSQRGERVKKVGCRSTHCVVHCVIHCVAETHWTRLKGDVLRWHGLGGGSLVHFDRF